MFELYSVPWLTITRSKVTGFPEVAAATVDLYTITMISAIHNMIRDDSVSKKVSKS